MCSVMMEDSEWLDSYQNTVLENSLPMETTMNDRITILNDIAANIAPASNQPHHQLDGQDIQCVDRSSAEEFVSKQGFRPQQHLTSRTVVTDLPATEFVVGSRSCVAAKSRRLLQRAKKGSLSRIQAVNHTVVFKKPHSEQIEG